MILRIMSADGLQKFMYIFYIRQSSLNSKGMILQTSQFAFTNVQSVYLHLLGTNFFQEC